MVPPNKIQKEYKTPAIPSHKRRRIPAPRVPSPNVITHDLGAMLMPFVDEQLPSIPSDSRITYAPSIAQDMNKQKEKLSASAMAPPLPTIVVTSPPMPHQTEAKAKMESVQSLTQNHNEVKKKKKKKQKSTYSDNKNHEVSGARAIECANGVLIFNDFVFGTDCGREQTVHKHAFMLFKSVRRLILYYRHWFLYNAATYFKHIQRFTGTRTSVECGKQDYTNK